MAIGLSAAVLLPLVQMFLAALYFRVGSPWSSVLNSKGRNSMEKSKLN